MTEFIKWLEKYGESGIHLKGLNPFEYGQAIWIVMQKDINRLRSLYVESVAEKCKCKANTVVNHDLVDHNLDLKKEIKRLKKKCGEEDND